jgi:hypothetical protein
MLQLVNAYIMALLTDVVNQSNVTKANNNTESYLDRDRSLYFVQAI